ncbi:tryptophan synthase beta subunit-like PLP-dependent enzyme [Elsinoe ampelina]|uniref:L-serine ammonia-lyase n=1 Tax=Elsinoe ampelina TaxID=302913 RepID=A0A6A6G965_9PEZI|nr:tryptophan synthase beta subunit-like PLP-dependent enzyme [Elsinoe ampelina]
MGAQTLAPKPKPWIETPLTESAPLSKAAGCRILLKHDHLQPSGSFKSRGLGLYMLRQLASSPAPSRVAFYCSSGGNAGLACVHAANALGRPATVVVPTATKDFMVAKLRAAGARQVVQIGRQWGEADRYLREEVIPAAEARGEVPVYVMPFDHEAIWEGHSTVVDEVKVQLEDMGVERPDVVVCSVGGGGLINGICEGVERYGWDGEGTKVLGMETRGAESFNRCVVEGRHARLEGIESQATSLGALSVSRRSYELLSTREYVQSAVLSDGEAAMGCWRLAEDENLLVELACGVNVALCYGGRLEQALGRPVKKDDVVVIEVCGGNAVTVDMMCEWKREHGYLDDRISKKEKATVPSANTNGYH